MNADMKDLMNDAEEKGYTIVKFDEYEFKTDEQVHKRFLMVFEAEEWAM